MLKTNFQEMSKLVTNIQFHTATYNH